jgi:transcriptional regulator with AAA-type ATPase domain/NAD-dependent dihydropyrimidine dehydrogenase PreA subunit
MTFSDLVTWLQERTALSILSEEVLAAIAPSLERRIVEANQKLAIEKTNPDGLYILRSGHLESENKGDRTQEVGLLPGSVINLQELILNEPVRDTIVTINECEFEFLSVDRFQELVKEYPEITQVFSQKLIEEIEELSSRLSFEQERQTVLRPYLVTKARRGIIGKSRYAVRLRSQIKQASESRQSVLIFGEPGLEKDNMAALIHFGSAYRHQPIVKLDCSTLQASGADLFGRAGGKMGILEALEEGMLILNNIQELPKELIKPIAELIRTNSYQPVSRQEENEPKKNSLARIVIISEKSIVAIDSLVGITIKVPPLRVRKGDIEDLVNYNISLISRAKGIKKSRITLEALRRLQTYDFPNNQRELENLIQRAIVQLQGCTDITEEILWSSQSKKKQFRLNLLNAYPRLRRFLRSPWWTDRINYGFTLVAFAVINLILWFGPQTRSHNFALNLFWAWWWSLVLIGFPFVGRVWCAVCPFMIYGELTQKLSLWLFPRQLKKWNRQAAEKWGGWFLFGLFALILLWEEVWNLENTAYLASCLLLLITAGAVIFSTIFERRFWCRYLCPIGGMNGMFAKLSMTELRAQQGICSAECTTYQCYKGGPQKGEGMESDGCPLYSHPAQLEDNRDCVLCMTCLKACPHRSVEFNLRPPGIELWTTHIPRNYEVALLFLLLDAVFLHHLPEIQTKLGLNLDLTRFGTHFTLSVIALSVPALIPFAGYGLMRLVYSTTQKIQPRRFIELAYGYLPLVLAGNLAHYLRLFLGEAGRILPVSFATFGMSGEGLPILVAHPAVTAFLQGTVLVTGVILSIILSQKIARQPLKLIATQHLCTILLAVGMWKAIL